MSTKYYKHGDSETYVKVVNGYEEEGFINGIRSHGRDRFTCAICRPITRKAYMEIRDRIVAAQVPPTPPVVDKQKSWDEYFMGMAAYVATRSKDPSTKVGAVITGPDNRIRSTGYNGLPSGVQEIPDRTIDRDTKLLFTAHAEQNSIFSAAKTGVPLAGCTLYVHGLRPCAECAKAIIQSGIVRVVVSDSDMPARWVTSMCSAYTMLEEAGITLIGPRGIL